jgi:hypothetical protein
MVRARASVYRHGEDVREMAAEMAAGYVVLARYDGQWSSNDEGDDSPPFDGLGAGAEPVADVTVAYHSTREKARTEAVRRGGLGACLYVHIAKLLDEEVGPPAPEPAPGRAAPERRRRPAV